jgi:coenzyme Q-binding protein COQ10
MLTQSAERLLPYSPEQLFDLAADVERYPEFLRWWITARVRRREGEVYYTDQALGLGPVRLRFGSRTELHRPERIDVTSDESPFRQFKLSWFFESLPGVRCRVTLAAQLELHSYLLQRLAEQVLPGAVADIVAAFETRAHRLYRDAETNKGALRK